MASKKLSKREKLLGLLEMSHKSLREMKDEDLVVAEPEVEVETEETEVVEAVKPEEPGFLEKLSKWLDE